MSRNWIRYASIFSVFLLQTFQSTSGVHADAPPAKNNIFTVTVQKAHPAIKAGVRPAIKSFQGGRPAAAGAALPSQADCEGSPILDFFEGIFDRSGQLSRYIICLGTPEYKTSPVGTGAKTLDKSFDQLSAYIIDSDRLYPGSLVQGAQSEIDAGHLSAIFPQGGPGTVTITGATFADGSSSVSKHVDVNSLATINQAISDLIHQPFLPDQLLTAAPTYYQVFSQDQAAAELNASFSGYGVSASGFYNTASDSTKNKIEFVFLQTLFEASFSPDQQEAGPSAFFTSDTSKSSVKAYLTTDNPPLYVSNVGYGRALYFLLSCSASMQKVQAGLTAAISSIMASGSASVSTSQRMALSQCSIQSLAIGGHYSYAVPILTTFAPGQDLPERLAAYVAGKLDLNSAAPTDQMFAQPLWYKLNYVADLRPAEIGTTVTYNDSFVTPKQYVSMDLYGTICDDDKEKETPIIVSITGGDGTAYLSNATVLGSTPCGDNNCGGQDYYWGTHGGTYSVPRFSLSVPMDNYDAGDSTIQINGPGDSWEASFAMYGIASDGTKRQVLSTGCINFNRNGAGSSSGPLSLNN